MMPALSFVACIRRFKRRRMLEICKENKEKVLREIRKGRVDAAEVSAPNFIDTMLRKSHDEGTPSGQNPKARESTDFLGYSRVLFYKLPTNVTTSVLSFPSAWSVMSMAGWKMLRLPSK